MKKETFIVVLLISLIVFFGCAGSSSKAPVEPEGPGELSFIYCRAVTIDNQIHVQWKASRPSSGTIRYGRGALSQTFSVVEVADSQDVLLFPLDYHSQLYLPSDSCGHLGQHG